MMFRLTKALFLTTVFGLLASCATPPPKDTTDICSMFEERRSWYKAAVRSEDSWNVPIHVSMAFIQQESSYQAGAKPPRRKYFGFIPGRRPSSAYGYAQVLDETWTEYKQQAGNWGARRSDFTDAVDFVGWYNSQSYKKLGLPRNDAYSLYLAYHEGHGGFSRRTYQSKGWLLDVASKVQRNADSYQLQYQECEKELGRNWFMRLLF